MNLERFLQNPVGSGWREFGRRTLAVRTYAGKILQGMRDILDQMETSMGARCRQWRVLEAKRRKLEVFYHTKLEQELRNLEALQRNLPSQRRRRLPRQTSEAAKEAIRDILEKVDDELGVLNFGEYFMNFVSKCMDIVSDQLEKLASVMSARQSIKYNSRLQKMHDSATELYGNVVEYFSLMNATGSDLDFATFWEALLSAHVLLRDINFLITGSTANDALEKYLGLTLVDYGQFAPIMAGAGPAVGRVQRVLPPLPMQHAVSPPRRPPPTARNVRSPTSPHRPKPNSPPRRRTAPDGHSRLAAGGLARFVAPAPRPEMIFPPIIYRPGAVGGVGARRGVLPRPGGGGGRIPRPGRGIPLPAAAAAGGAVGGIRARVPLRTAGGAAGGAVGGTRAHVLPGAAGRAAGAAIGGARARVPSGAAGGAAGGAFGGARARVPPGAVGGAAGGAFGGTRARVPPEAAGGAVRGAFGGARPRVHFEAAAPPPSGAQGRRPAGARAPPPKSPPHAGRFLKRR